MTVKSRKQCISCGRRSMECGTDEAVENILNMFVRTKNNRELCADGKENENLYVKEILA